MRIDREGDLRISKMMLRRVWYLACLLPAVVIAAPVSNDQQILQAGDLAQRPLGGGGGGGGSSETAQRKLHGKFLHITDFHPDEFYKAHSSTEEGIACHHGKGPAGKYGAETSDCDSPIALVNATFDWMAGNLKDEIDFVIWTGDSARHDSDEDIPRSPADVLGTNRLVADKFAEVFSDSKGMNVPVIPTFGNNDILPHNVLLPGPNNWLRYYTDVWRAFIPEAQRHSFEFGGWFYVEVIPKKLAVFSLNTLYFFERNAGVDDCQHPSEPGFKQLEWLRVQLQFLRERGMKAILMGHVPPARTGSKQLWDETCWQKYTLWLRQYRDVVAGSIYGHMNIDHFLLQDTHDIEVRSEGFLGPEVNTRASLDDELTVQSGADYLKELRDDWSKLPKPQPAKTKSEIEIEKKKDKKKGKKGKDKLGPWAERYQLSMVSPSIVPNYFPTIRVIEYNISGLDTSVTWADVLREDTAMSRSKKPKFDETNDKKLMKEIELAKKKKKNGKKHKGGKTKPKDPNLNIPKPPSSTAPPGPAYSMQPLTFTGYTQYYANLTYINNDIEDASVTASILNDGVEEERWKPGKHHGKKPKHSKPKPRTFGFEVEYSTFDDKLYKLKDLTVRSMVDLAYRIGQVAVKSKAEPLEESELNGDEEDEDDQDIDIGTAELKWDVDELDDSGHDLGEDEEYEDSDEVDTESKKGKKHKGKKGDKKKKKKQKKLWLHFLDHAFVKTVDKDDLKKYR